MSLRKLRSSIATSKRTQVEAALAQRRKTLMDYFIANRPVGHRTLAHKLTKLTKIKVVMLEIMQWREDCFRNDNGSLQRRR